MKSEKGKMENESKLKIQQTRNQEPATCFPTCARLIFDICEQFL